jgi:hypothetical protein
MTLHLEQRQCDLDPFFLPNNVTAHCLENLVSNSSLHKVLNPQLPRRRMRFRRPWPF